MTKQITKIVMILFLSILIIGCEAGKQVELDVEVNVTLDGKPAPQAKVLLDNVEVGATDSSGEFSKRIRRQPGAEVFVAVQKEATGYDIEPWKGSFVVKLPKERIAERYPFKVALTGTKFFTLYVTENDEPLEGASVRIQDKVNVKTDEGGEYAHTYQVLPKKGLKISVSKKGYKTWRKRVKVEPGERVEVSLYRKKEVAEAPGKEAPAAEAPVAKAPTAKEPAAAQPVAKAPKAKAPAAKVKPKKGKAIRATVSVTALTEAYGVSKGVPDVVVHIDDKEAGKTNAKGVYTYAYKGKPGKQAQLKLTAPGYIPHEWHRSVDLAGTQFIKRFFYPAKPESIKVGVYGYVNNTPEEDLS